MSEMVHIRSVKEYFNEFGVDGIGKGVKREYVLAQITDEFRREVFGQLMFKYKVADVNDIPANPETEAYYENLMRNTQKKWWALARLFDKYVETRKLITKPLKLFDEPDEKDIVEDGEYNVLADESEGTEEGDYDPETDEEEVEEDSWPEEDDSLLAAESDGESAEDSTSGSDISSEGDAE